MCGIAGLFHYGAGAGFVRRESLVPMVGSIRHRGPDDTGLYAEGPLGLGHARLSIVDVAGGHQPIWNEDRSVAVVLNGEIYNHRLLRRELESRGHHFATRSDTEVIVHLYEELGAGCVERLAGMFAIAVADFRHRRLLLARDRVGKKPLYLADDGRRLGFASELKSLLAGGLIAPEIDPEALELYLTLGYVPAPWSIFRGAKKLPAGHLAVCDSRGVRLERYWDVEPRSEPSEPEEKSREEWVEELEALLAEAVRDRLESEVPLGAFLSGGIDSSLVVSLMQAWSARPVKTFTIGFDAAEHDESAHAAAVARHLGTEHTSVTLTGDDALASIPDLPRLFDEPLADPSLIPTLLVSRVARRDVTVALSGDGGDELFAGYNRYVSGERAIRRAVRIPSPVRRALAAGLSAPSPATWDRMYAAVAPLLPASARARLPGDKAHKLAALLRQPGAAGMYRSLLSQWSEPERVARGAREPAGVVERVMGGAMPLMERMQLADQLGYLPDDLLAKLDRASMSVGLEARVPLLDHRVAELAWSLPRALRVRGGEGKWILRRILHRHVPPALVDRPKTGFTVPLDAWLRGPLRQWAGDLLSPAAVRRSGLLDVNAVDAAWRDFQAGRGRGGLAIWAVLVLLQWHEQWVQAPAREPERRPVVLV
jgi:asparagine synthase (glutamine-hydrolysing)